MCRIKMGAEITQIHEVQNLVTAYILRAKTPYTISRLSDRVIRSCAGSTLTITENQIRQMVEDTTLALLRAKYISSNDGYYYAYPILIQNNE